MPHPPRAPDGAGAVSGPRIHLLPDPLIDQIAAGEVVERPASVVKELVENALDAGAHRIRVDLRQGGIDWIAVSDDGGGMTAEEAQLALQRHATSKVATADDLRRIHTFGFRGEALPAIAAVSRLRLRTRPSARAEGVELLVDGGKLLEERAAAGPVGTRIEVAELFVHVPARRKFLKTAATEWGHVSDWLARAALALPEIHFDVQRDDRTAFAWPAVADPLDRIAAVLSDDEASALVAVGREGGGMRIHGFASRPDHHRPTAAGIHLFVNGRPVRDRLFRHAVTESYRDLMPRGRFPIAVLFLDLEPEAVDVNVHPAKWEVRFRDPRQVHQLVRTALRSAIETRGWYGPGRTASGPSAPQPSAPQPSAPQSWAPGQVADAPGSATDWLFAQRSELPLAGLSIPEPGPLRLAELPHLGQVLATYLVLEGPEALLLVDQHAAHERVLFERLRAQWRREGVERQALLFLATVELEPASVAAIESAPTLELGFEVESFGERAVAVRAVPALLAERDPGELIRALAAEIRAAQSIGADLDLQQLEAADRLFASLACHAARRAGDRLDAAEQRALLQELDAIPWAPSCPHGRPVVVPIERGELERRFARR